MLSMNRRLLLAMCLLAICTPCASPHPASPAPIYAYGKARLADEGPDIVILHPPDGFLVEDATKLVVAFYVSSFCVARLGDGLEVMRFSASSRRDWRPH
jgi:hypothetical protein